MVDQINRSIVNSSRKGKKTGNCNEASTSRKGNEIATPMNQKSTGHQFGPPLLTPASVRSEIQGFNLNEEFDKVFFGRSKN